MLEIQAIAGICALTRFSKEDVKSKGFENVCCCVILFVIIPDFLTTALLQATFLKTKGNKKFYLTTIMRIYETTG